MTSARATTHTATHTATAGTGEVKVCPVCRQRSRDGGLCGDDTQHLLTLLGAGQHQPKATTRPAGRQPGDPARQQSLVELLDELEVTFTRLSVHGSRAGARSATRPLPANLHAAQVAADIRTALRTWANVYGAAEIPDRAAQAWITWSIADDAHSTAIEHHQAAQEDLRSAIAVLDTAINAGQATTTPLRTTVTDRNAAVNALAEEIVRLEAIAATRKSTAEAWAVQAETLRRGPAGVASWMAAHSTRIRTHPTAAQLLRDLQHHADRAERAIDTPPELIPLGECGGQIVRGPSQPCQCSCHTGGRYRPACDLDGGCGSLGCSDGLIDPPARTCTRRLYAEPGQDAVRCRDCFTVVDVAARRDAVIANAQHSQGRAAFLSDLCRRLGYEISASMIRNWAVYPASRPRLTAVHTDDDGRPWYRLSDVLAAHRAVQAAKAADAAPAAQIPAQAPPPATEQQPEQQPQPAGAAS